MTHLSPNYPFGMGYDDPYPFNLERTFPRIRYNRHQRHLRNNPVDMHTLGLLSSLGPPHLSHWNGMENLSGDYGGQVSKKGIIIDKDNDLHVQLDVGLFEPKELSVKIVDNFLIIEGKHDERQAEDVGFVARHFIRRYKLPHDHNPDDIISELSPDGVLTVILPKVAVEQKERVIPIQHTGPSEVFSKKYNKSDKVVNTVEEEKEEEDEIKEE